MSVTIPLYDAPKFLAALVKEGVTFEAHAEDRTVTVVFTGGY